MQMINIFINTKQDVDRLLESLDGYQRASSARVNWEKSEARQLGQWGDRAAPSLPGALRWGKGGLRVLGVFLGSDNFRNKNWEGLEEKVCARLSRWKWLLPQLSYRGRVLVANNGGLISMAQTESSAST